MHPIGTVGMPVDTFRACVEAAFVRLLQIDYSDQMCQVCGQLVDPRHDLRFFEALMVYFSLKRFDPGWNVSDPFTRAQVILDSLQPVHLDNPSCQPCVISREDGEASPLNAQERQLGNLIYMAMRGTSCEHVLCSTQ